MITIFYNQNSISSVTGFSDYIFSSILVNVLLCLFSVIAFYLFSFVLPITVSYLLSLKHSYTLVISYWGYLFLYHLSSRWFYINTSNLLFFVSFRVLFHSNRNHNLFHIFSTAHLTGINIIFLEFCISQIKIMSKLSYLCLPF